LPFYPHNRFEKRYKKEVEEPELERVKKVKAELRDLHKPIDRNELLEHEKKVDKNLEELREKHSKKSETSASASYKKPSYESKFHKMFEEEQEKIKSTIDKEKERRKKMRESLVGYGEDIREHRKPTVDPAKEFELKRLTEKMENYREKYPAVVDTAKECEVKKLLSQLGKLWMQEPDKVDKKKEKELLTQLDELGIKKRSKTADEDSSEDEESARYKAMKYWQQVKDMKDDDKTKTLDVKGKDGKGKSLHKSKSPKTADRLTKDKSHTASLKVLKGKFDSDGKKTNLSIKSDTVVKNYLPEVKKRFKHKSQLDEIGSVLKNSNIDEATKKEYLRSMVDKLEEGARRKEQLTRLKPHGKEMMEEDPEVDDMYIKAIRAKLEILSDSKGEF